MIHIGQEAAERLVKKTIIAVEHDYDDMLVIVFDDKTVLTVRCHCAHDTRDAVLTVQLAPDNGD